MDRIVVMMKCAPRSPRDLFRDERGVTTTGMVLSLLISLSLVFTGAQVYRVNSASAEVQDVADAAALAAENQVAEYMVVARFCDAVVLSLSLASVTVLGVGIAALCTPAAELSKGLIDAGEKLVDVRDEFSDRATRALGKLQKALPYYSAACAAGVAAANDADSTGSRYVGVALLVPQEGKVKAPSGSDASDKLIGEIDDKADEIREKARQADEAARKANEAKARGFEADCGRNPDRCMYERASSLIGLSGASNPLYTSVDAWSFSVALERAKAYYAARRFDATPAGTAPKDEASLRLMRRFCSYAYDLISREGYVHEDGGTFAACFPALPAQIGEIKETSLYTDAVYPITEEPVGDGGEPLPVMHAWDGCPGMTGEVVLYNSIAYMESANLPTCPYCDFTLDSMGRIASANSSIDTGFEKHYGDCARAAAEYQEERKLVDEQRAEVEAEAGGLFDKLVEAFKDAADKRIDVTPPGASGALAFVVNVGSTPAAEKFASGFVPSGGALGPRAAIGAATLIDEGSDEGRTVLNSALDGIREDGSVAVGALGVALDAWSAALSAYGNGVDSLADGIESGLNALPLVGASGLGGWAANKLRSVIEDVGLQPAQLNALKPVLVNSAHVATQDRDGPGARLVAVKQKVIAHPLASTDLFSAVLTDAEKTAVAQVEGLGDSIEIASVELLGDSGPSISIAIPVPAEVKQYGIGTLQGLFERLRAQHAETAEVRAWE